MKVAFLNSKNPQVEFAQDPFLIKRSSSASLAECSKTNEQSPEETSSTGVFLTKRKKLFEAQEALERQREIYKQ